MDLSVQPIEDGDPVEGGETLEFGWRNHGAFAVASDASAQAGCPTDTYSGDTASLLVKPNEPLAPVVLFDPKEQPEGMYFEPVEPEQRYLVTLTVDRTINEREREKRVEIAVTPKDVDLMQECKSAVLMAATPVLNARWSRTWTDSGR